MGTCLLGAVIAGGCALSSVIQLPPVDLDLMGAGAGTFSAKAGEPVRNVARFSGVQIPVNLGGGGFTLPLDALQITPGDGTGNKRLVSGQASGSLCLDACTAAGVDGDVCSLVCQDGTLVIHVWVGPADAIEADCESGVLYTFEVTLDASGQPTGVTVTPDSFEPETLALLTGGEEIGICIELIAPFDATITLGSITLNFRL
ncbi:MAG: hypothetical protein D6788_07930 [Planctomycetota bacterium]|nr:MAG: hypothetical protein D6788_07930 [Planctomycetota bacterium]